MNDSYIIGQMNTFMHQLSEKMSDWLEDKLPKLTENWWIELVYNNLSQLQRDNVDAKKITELKGLDAVYLIKENKWALYSSADGLIFKKRDSLDDVI